MKFYRAVNNRCAVDFKSLNLPISIEDAVFILKLGGFQVINVDIITLARQYVGKSVYRRGARILKAPYIFDCSSLIKWLYGQRGIWLPRRSIQQRELGITINLSELLPGDVVFTSGYVNYFTDNPKDGVGHVGIATDKETIIHAASKKVGVVETSISSFVTKNNFRGARRYIPKDRIITTLIAPKEREVETSDDIKWIILQNLPRIK